jgi:transposase
MVDLDTLYGFLMSRTAHASFVLDALEQAIQDRRPAHRGGLIRHSDRGGQYASIKYPERLAEAGIEPLVGSVGDSYDNALAETINGLYKAEVIYRRGARRSDEWAGLDRQVKKYDDELAALTCEDDQARRLATIPGIGVINATALMAAIGDGSAFAKGRDLAAWLGLTPRQHSTGGKTRLHGISKRGNGYLRKQLIHGARAAMPHLAAKPD